MKFLVLFFAMSLPLFTACATLHSPTELPELVLNPIAKPDQQLEYVNGAAVICSLKSNTVCIQLYRNDQITNGIWIAVRNDTSKPAHLIVEDIKLTYGSTVARLYSFDEIVERVQDVVPTTSSNAFLLGLTSAFYNPTNTTAVNGNYGSKTELQNRSGQSLGYNAATTGTFNATIVQQDSAAAERRRAETMQKIAALNQQTTENYQSIMSFVQRHYLRSNTVHPGFGYDGFIKYFGITAPTGTKALLTVKFGDETHAFEM